MSQQLPIIRIVLGLYLLGACSWCGKPKDPGAPVKPAEVYQARVPEEPSTLNIPLEFDMNDLTVVLNRQLAGLLYVDSSFTDGDNMTVRAEKREDFRLSASNERIRYRIPLGLFIRYDFGIAKVAAFGDIALTFETGVSIDEAWTLETETKLLKYEWLETPRLRFGSLAVPVGKLSTYFLERGQDEIAKAVDEMVAQNFNLRSYVQDAWNQMHQAQLVSEEYNAWLTVNPKQMTMTPLRTVGNALKATISVETYPELTFAAPPPRIGIPRMPNFTYAKESREDFTLYVGALVTYEEAERLMQQSVVGERYESGRRYVIVNDVELFGQEEELVVNVNLSGSYNGNIYLEGRPVFNPDRNAIDVEDLEYDLDTRNFLVRTAGWLLQSTLKRQIQSNLDFLLEYNLQDLQDQLQAQLEGYELAPGIRLSGQMREVNLYDAYLVPEGMRVNVAIRGRIGLNVAGLLEGATR